MRDDGPWAHYLRGSIKNMLKEKNDARADWQRSIELEADINKYLARLTDLR